MQIYLDSFIFFLSSLFFLHIPVSQMKKFEYQA